MDNLEKKTDSEIVLDIVEHIKNPCFFEVGSREYLSLRESYICWAENVIIPKLKNPYAIKYLKDYIGGLV